MTDPIADFYTRHPYPPPVENLDRARDEWRDDARRRAEFHLLWPARPYHPDLDILVAGCGTWQAAKHALTHPAARVVGIDVSPTSLAATDKLKQQYGLTNLETCELAIEGAGTLGRAFDLAVCTGVLHHLADPEAGLRALRAVLKPHGALYLMVYAPYGRAGVSMMQEYCRRLGIGSSDTDIRELTTTLGALPPRHPLAAALQTSRDGKDPHALADALLNPRDRAYSVPEVFGLIDRGGLTFERWYWQAPYLPQCGAIAGTPHASRLAALSEREQFAAMELWRGTMTAHSVVLRPGDGETASPQLAADRWAEHVPIRLPSTLCVQERLPPGAAAVLLNRSHPFPDLVLAIDAQEKRMFEAIDGRRRIADIMHDTLSDERRARVFLETLFEYDQVVFDRSHESARS